MYVEKGLSFNVLVFNESDYYQANLFLKLYYKEDPDIPLRDVSLSHVTSLLALFCMYGLDYSRPSVPVPIYPGMSGKELATASPGHIAVACHCPENVTKGLLLY